MNRFAALLDRLAYEPGRNSKLRLLTGYFRATEDPDLAAEAFRSGASAYLLKRSTASELTTAITEVMSGRAYITPLVASGLVGSLLHPDEHAPSHVLTARQREVLQLLAEGHSMKEAASVCSNSRIR